MTLFDTILDSAEISISCAYAAWLYRHKSFEPDMTWLEVALGTAYTLAFAYARGAYHQDDWQAQANRTIREFFISAPPIIVGELIQKLEARHALRGIEEEFPR
jgi:hypothetical protein